MTRILVLGGSGMLGHAAFRMMADAQGIEAFATLRTAAPRRFFPEALQDRLLDGVDAFNMDALTECLGRVRPDLVINCVGLVKQHAEAADPIAALSLNALLPHRLARLCALLGARLVHISTDCVFCGDRGGYREDDLADASDLYGRSKLLGEVDAPNAITLRTSIIGHELGTRHGLLEWFLGEVGPVRGFTRAIFSGVTTDELSRVILMHVLPNPQLHGVWHVAAAPTSKYDLLALFREVYGQETEIRADMSLVIDRSLDGRRFAEATGYAAPTWPEMIRSMHTFGARA